MCTPKTGTFPILRRWPCSSEQHRFRGLAAVASDRAWFLRRTSRVRSWRFPGTNERLSEGGRNDRTRLLGGFGDGTSWVARPMLYRYIVDRRTHVVPEKRGEPNVYPEDWYLSNSRERALGSVTDYDATDRCRRVYGRFGEGPSGNVRATDRDSVATAGGGYFGGEFTVGSAKVLRVTVAEQKCTQVCSATGIETDGQK